MTDETEAEDAGAKTDAPDLSVVIVNWNTADLLQAALLSLDRHLDQVAHEVIVVDNASSDRSVQMVHEVFPQVRLICNDENVGFGRANNQGMTAASGEWLLLLNSDAELLDDSVARLLVRMKNDSGVGVGHCRLLSADDTQQYTTYRFPSMQIALLDGLGLNNLLPRRQREALLAGYWDQSYDRDVDWVAAAFMLIRREVFAQTGGFDPTIFMYGEDLEWCWRIRDAGWRIRFYADGAVRHQNHVSSDLRWGAERIAICLARQHEIVVARRGRAVATAIGATGFVGTCLRALRYSVFAFRSQEDAVEARAIGAYQRALVRILCETSLRAVCQTGARHLSRAFSGSTRSPTGRR